SRRQNAKCVRPKVPVHLNAQCRLEKAYRVRRSMVESSIEVETAGQLRTVVALGPVPEHDFGDCPTLGVRHRDYVAVVSTVSGEPSREGPLRHTSEGVAATI